MFLFKYHNILTAVITLIATDCARHYFINPYVNYHISRVVHYVMSFQRQQKHLNNLVWTLNYLYFILLYKTPSLMSWAKKKFLKLCVEIDKFCPHLDSFCHDTKPGDRGV